MLIRFTQDVRPSGNTSFDAGRLYDLDTRIAQAFITQGVAVSGDAVNADKSTVPGSATINAPMGKFAIAAGASSAVITNALCRATSIVQLQAEGGLDTTLTRASVAAANGSFTVTGNANATAAQKFNFQLANP